MNQTLLRQLAEERLLEARALFDAGKWSGAYYLGGYALECGFKTSIASYTQQADFPDKIFAEKCFVHNLEKLREVADLKKTFDNDVNANRNLGNNWTIVKDWSERARYRLFTQTEATLFLRAVDDPTSGVMTWLRAHY